jgi:hypothetical protein
MLAGLCLLATSTARLRSTAAAERVARELAEDEQVTAFLAAFRSASSPLADRQRARHQVVA